MNRYDAVQSICRRDKIIPLVQHAIRRTIWLFPLLLAIESQAGDPPSKRAASNPPPSSNYRPAQSRPVAQQPPPNNPFLLKPSTPFIFSPPPVNNNMAGSTPAIITPKAQPPPQPKPNYWQVQPSISYSPSIQQPLAPRASAYPSSGLAPQPAPSFIPGSGSSYSGPSATTVPKTYPTYNPPVPYETIPNPAPTSPTIHPASSYYTYPPTTPVVTGSTPLWGANNTMAHTTPAMMAAPSPRQPPVFQNNNSALNFGRPMSIAQAPVQPFKSISTVITPNAYAGMRTVYPLSPPPVGQIILNGQCTSYAATRFDQAAGISDNQRDFRGNAKDWYDAASKKWVTLGPYYTSPPPGSVAVYDDSVYRNGQPVWNGLGHVAVVEADLNTGIKFSEQNWPNGNPVRTINLTPEQYEARSGLNHNYKLIGFVVPVKKDQSQ